RHPDPLGGEVEHRDHDQRADDGDEGARYLGSDSLQHDDERERAGTHGEGGRVGASVGDALDELAPLGGEKKPRGSGGWPTMTGGAMPLRYPTRPGVDRRSVRKPKRASPAAMQ